MVRGRHWRMTHRAKDPVGGVPVRLLDVLVPAFDLVVDCQAYPQARAQRTAHCNHLRLTAGLVCQHQTLYAATHTLHQPIGRPPRLAEGLLQRLRQPVSPETGNQQARLTDCSPPGLLISPSTHNAGRPPSRDTPSVGRHTSPVRAFKRRAGLEGASALPHPSAKETACSGFLTALPRHSSPKHIPAACNAALNQCSKSGEILDDARVKQARLARVSDSAVCHSAPSAVRAPGPRRRGQPLPPPHRPRGVPPPAAPPRSGRGRGRGCPEPRPRVWGPRAGGAPRTGRCPWRLGPGPRLPRPARPRRRRRRRRRRRGGGGGGRRGRRGGVGASRPGAGTGLEKRNTRCCSLLGLEGGVLLYPALVFD